MSAIFFSDSVITHASSAADCIGLQYCARSDARMVLESLWERRARMGLIAHLGEQPQELLDQALNKSGLLGFFDPKLVIYSDGFTETALAEAMSKAGPPPGRSLFVGQHREERAHALQVGFDAAIPHPLLVSELMHGGTLAYVRVSGLHGEYRDGRLKRFLNMPVAPLYFTREREGTAYGITSAGITETLRSMGFDVKIFGGEHDPQVTDLYLAHDDRAVPEGYEPAEYSTKFLARQGKAGLIVEPVEGALMLALPPDVSIEEIHFPKAKHGHNQMLLADTTLLAGLAANVPAASAESRFRQRAYAPLTEDELRALRDGITSTSIERLHAPYIGDASLYVGGEQHLIKSRHIKSPGNELVTRALCEHLKTIGGGLLKVRRHNFLYNSLKLSNVEAELPGSEPNSVVIISAHFDSIALDVQDSESAPGADDDASGMAAVLAAAEMVVKLRAAGQLRRSLRFLFFNAEEQGLVGSKEYAGEQCECGPTIVGVFQMDMIGFPGKKPNETPEVFELHAGCSNYPQAEMKSVELAQRVSDMAALVSPSLTNIQFYPVDVGYDPAEDRSDHHAFHAGGVAACMASEDYNTDRYDPKPDPQVNPDYHESTDKRIDCAYAAEIARAVVAAALLTAKN